jgi:hypothetical protein
MLSAETEEASVEAMAICARSGWSVSCSVAADELERGGGFWGEGKEQQ